MDSTVLVALIMLAAGVIATGIPAYLGYFMQLKRRKIVDDKDKMEGLDLGGSTVLSFIQAAQLVRKEADEYKIQNEAYQKEIMSLRQDVEELKKARIEDREEFRKALEQERERSDKCLKEEIDKSRKIADYNTRLIYQLKSWGISEVPLDIEAAKLELKQDFIDGDDFKKVPL
jgi:hypothetical protein